MEQPNELPVEKIACLEARIQQKNEDKIAIREKMTQFQTQKRQFEVKFQTGKQQLEAKHKTEKQQLDAKFQPKKEQLETMNNVLKLENNAWEMDIGKLRTELKAIKLQSSANHCVRHPRMLAGLRVDCGGGQQQRGHLLCAGCIRNGSTFLIASLTSAGHCPFCGKHMKGGGIGASELKQLVNKLFADERMMRPDAFLPLPFELNAEVWELAKKNQRFVLYGNNRLENLTGGFLTFLSDDCLSVCKGKKTDNSGVWSTVRAVKPICVLKAALVDYYIPDIFYFEVLVKTGCIYIGLSGPDFPLSSNNTYVGREPGSYSFSTWADYEAHDFKQSFKDEKGWYALGGNYSYTCDRTGGDVAGCGLLLSPNGQHRIFFTKNGQLFCKPFLLPAMDNSQVLFPTVTLISDTSIVANFGDDPEKPFCYKFRKEEAAPLSTWILSALFVMLLLCSLIYYYVM